MSKSKNQLLCEMRFIEEYTEHVFESHTSNIYNDLQEFCANYLQEAKDNQEDEIWLYCDASESDIW